MNNLCICQYGHCRSVALARELHSRGERAVAVGWATCGSRAIEILSDWADRIYVLDAAGAVAVPATQRHKLIVLDVGPDRWSNPYHPELAALIRQKMNKEK